MKAIGSIIFFLFIMTGYAQEMFIGELNYAQKWTKIAKSEELAKLMILGKINQSAYGKKIVQAAQRKARKSGKRLVDLIVVGHGSITDTTLIRRFSKSNPDIVEYEDRSKVYINGDLSVKDAILDMAHELTHFSYRTVFNPYKDGFTFASFLHDTIENRGGEVDAFISECSVLKDLFTPQEFRDSKCPSIIDSSTGHFSRKLTMEHFYQVGPLFQKFWDDSARFGVSKVDFPYLTSAQPIFISSAYSVPYPLATLIEYRNMMTHVCKNDERRLVYMKKKVGRSPASIVRRSYQSMEKSFFDRCQNINY